VKLISKKHLYNAIRYKREVGEFLSMSYNKGKGAYRDYDTRSEEALQVKQEMAEEQKLQLHKEERKVLDFYLKDKNKVKNENARERRKYNNEIQGVVRKIMQCEYTEQDGTTLTIAEKMGIGAIADYMQHPNIKDLMGIQKIAGEDGTSDFNVTVSIESLIKKVSSDSEF
jgi:hypothetical protein